MLDFILLLLIAAAAQIFGGILSWPFVKKFCHNIKIIVFAETFLMLVASLLLIKEGFKITPLAILSIILGIAVLAIFDRIIPHKHQTKTGRICFLVFIAMCFHEFPEGIAFGSSYLISPAFGLVTAIIIALHNIPEGSIVSIPYFMKKKFINGFKAVLATQILYVIGGLTAYFILLGIPQQLQALSMTFAAGAMIYIIIEELLWMRGCSK